MALSRHDNLAEEVETRLDELFDDNDGSLEGVEAGRSLEDSPLRELRAIVLSIDWEITDEAMTRFIDQVDRLRPSYQEDRLLLAFLQLLRPLGKYIKASKGRCLPEAIQLLNSVYTNFEKVASADAMPREQKKKILMAEVVRFKELKEQIAAHHGRKTPQGAANALSPPRTIGAGAQTVTLSRADLAFLVSEVTQVIRAEFDALRSELNTLCGAR
ncbi:MAG: hypothetical protein WCD46_08605 [Desulfobacterales bacterium]